MPYWPTTAREGSGPGKTGKEHVRTLLSTPTRITDQQVMCHTKYVKDQQVQNRSEYLHQGSQAPTTHSQEVLPPGSPPVYSQRPRFFSTLRRVSKHQPLGQPFFLRSPSVLVPPLKVLLPQWVGDIVSPSGLAMRHL